MRAKLRVVVVGVGLLVAALPALPHHSFAAEFDANKPVNLRGTITKMEWTNPHAWIYIDVKGTDGTIVNWAIEGGSPNVLLRRGFTKDSVKTGTEIVVNGFQAKDGSTRLNGNDITLPDGKKLFLGSSNNGAPDPGK